MDDFEVLDMSVSSDKSRGDRMWNGYRLERTLGRGEFATVKLAVDTIAQAKQAAPALVAIKFIKIVGKERSRVSREALVLASLQDGVAPNIVPIKAIMGTNEGVAIVMKYCRDGELFDLVERKRGLSEAEGRFFFRQLLTAVDYLHATLGIVHRDIKLENLLLDGTDLYLADFSFARHLEDSESDCGSRGLLMTACGSPTYAAPELVLQSKGYDGRAADVWSCGVVLFAMVAGYLPFEEHKDQEAYNLGRFYECIVRSKLSYPTKMSTALRELIGQMLHSDPMKRPTVRQMWQHPWLSATDSRQVNLPKSSSTSSTSSTLSSLSSW